MPRRLVLLRHGEAAAPPAGAGDRARPLTARGRGDAAAAGAWLAREGHVPTRALASPATRTLETARLALAAFGVDADADVVDSLYLADVDDLVTLAGTLAPPDAVTLLVGHNPGLSLLVAALVDDVPLALRSRGLLPGSAVVIDVPDAGDLVGAGALVAFRHPDAA